MCVVGLPKNLNVIVLISACDLFIDNILIISLTVDWDQ